MFGILFGFVFFPKALKSMIGKVSTNYISTNGFLLLMILQNIALKPGSEIRKMYTNVPFAITVKIYVFSVTNAAAVTKGEKPILQEVGPFFFE